MKKHNFNEAIEIFKRMFEGWSVVGKQGEKHQIYGIDLTDGTVYLNLGYFRDDQISHLEQTLPMNGDEVMAWDGEKDEKNKCFYIGRSSGGNHVCQTRFNAIVYKHVELISPVRTLTIKQATELLKGIVNEPFEIVK
jgi:hypothetical protein